MALPTTGFEDRNLDGAWTTFAEEGVYLSALLAEVPQIREEVIGQGATGLDIQMLKVGTGTRHVLLLAQVHANELSGRDALLSLIRDWATSTDADLISYLSEVTVLVIPTMRPDSQTQRNNANGVNINRDHVQLTQPETQAIHRVIRDYGPVLMVDVHEGRNITNDYATSPTLEPNAHPDIRGLSADMEGAIQGNIEGEGYSWEPYDNHQGVGPEYATNIIGLRHGVGMLLESKRTDLDDNLHETRVRYLTQVTAIESIVDWHSRNLSQVDSAVANSRQDADGLEVISFAGGASIGEPLDAFEGFQLSSLQDELMATVREIFELPERDTNGVVDTRGEQRVLVHLLMDNRSPHRIVSAHPVQDGGNEEDGVLPSSRPSSPTAFYRTSGVTQEVELIAKSGSTVATA